MPWYSAEGSLDALLIGRRIGKMHLVCYLRDGDRVFETYWTTRRGVEAMDYSYGLLDLTVYGRQETWEDSPAGWPQSPVIPNYAPTDVPPPSGPACKPDAPTTLAPPAPDPDPPPRTRTTVSSRRRHVSAAHHASRGTFRTQSRPPSGRAANRHHLVSGSAGWQPSRNRLVCPAVRAFRVSGRVRHEYPCGAKAGGSPGAPWTALQYLGGRAAVDADTLAIADEAVAGGVPPGAAAARRGCCKSGAVRRV